MRLTLVVIRLTLPLVAVNQMDHKVSSIALDVILAMAAGAIAAIAIIPFSIIALIVCVVVTAFKTRSRIRVGHARIAAAGVIASMLVFGGIVTAAALYRPSKIVEQQLRRDIRLPSTRMTLSELSYTATHDRRSA